MIYLGDTVSLLSKYGYSIVFPISVLEGPTVTTISGFLAGQGVFKLTPLFFIFLAGDFTGDFLYYAIGRYGGIPFVSKFERFFKIKQSDIEQMSCGFKKNDIKILLFGKLQPLGSLVLMTAGFVKMNFVRFITLNVLFSIPKVILFLFIGYYFGSAYAMFDGYIQKAGIVITFISVVWLILFFLNKKKK